MKIISVLLFLTFATSSWSQTTIGGRITDEHGEPIPGANITLKDTYDGASSDKHGLFSFTSSETGDQVIVVSFIGFKTFEQSISLSAKAIALEIKLKEEINLLDAVTITAGSFTAGEEKRRTVLKALDIATTAGATADISGALNTLPGTQKVGESGRLFVRGGDGSETRTFIDGMLVLDAYGPSAPNTPGRGRFSPFMFKGTSFSTGGYSAEYGQALSSALVLTSKDKAEITQTDIGLLSVGTDIAHTQSWERSSLSGKIQYTNIRPYFNLINQNVDWKTPPSSLEGIASYRLNVGQGGVFKFFGNFNRTNYSLYNHDVANPSITQLVRLDNDFTHTNASYLQNLNDHWMVRGGVSFTDINNQYKIDETPMATREKSLHSKLVGEYSPVDQVQINFGGEVINRDYVASRWNELSNQYESLSFIENLTSGFAEAQYFISNRLVTKAGGRFEYSSLNNKYSVDPRASLAFKPGKKGQFSFAYGTFRQTASNDLIRFNTSLLPERSEHYILNYQFVTDSRTFRIETYYKKYRDLVKYVNNNPTDLDNNGHGYAKGFEIFWRDNQTLKNVDYWISYSFLDTERDYLSFPEMAVPTFVSPHNFSIVYKHFITKLKTQIGATYSFASGRPYYNPNNDSFHSDLTPSYQDLSLNFSYLPKNWLILHLSCTNLLGRDNIFGYEFSQTPNDLGVYESRAIRQAAPRFLFLGVFITISKNKSVNQLPNL